MAFKSITLVTLITLTLSASVKGAIINNIKYTPDTFSDLDWLYPMESRASGTSYNERLVPASSVGSSKLEHNDALLGVGTNTRDSLGEEWMSLVFTIPAVIWLLGSGFFGLIGMVRRKDHA